MNRHDGADDGAGKASGNDAAPAEERLARLVRTIEGEIVPRLVVSRRVKTIPVIGGLPDSLDVKELVRLLLAHESDVAMAYVETLRQRGTTLDVICLELLAPAARELGLLWEEDECDFMQVTVGLCRLHQVLRALSPEFACEDAPYQGDRRILMAAYPGDQHTFGVTLVAQFLRRAGWDVWQEYPQTAAELIDMTRETAFFAVGLSVGCDTRLDDVGKTIRAIRIASRNRAVGVLVGGPVLLSKPDLVADLGADATATDGRDAVLQAQMLRDGGWRREFGIAR